MHLWETKHDYYCNDENYHSSGQNEYQSWADFIEEWRTSEFHSNLVFRWDWKKDGDISDLHIYFMLQRKGVFLPCLIHSMRDEDEPAVVQFLRPRFTYLKKLWEPITDE